MVDRNSLVFNSVCQMFQLVCILLQAIACCTKRNLKELFQVFCVCVCERGDADYGGGGWGGSVWVAVGSQRRE